MPSCRSTFLLCAVFHKKTLDEDIDCEGELVCFYPTEEIRIVPGCKGPPTPDWEYCTDPKAIEEHTKRFGSVNLNSTDDSQ